MSFWNSSGANDNEEIVNEQKNLIKDSFEQLALQKWEEAQKLMEKALSLQISNVDHPCLERGYLKNFEPFFNQLYSPTCTELLCHLATFYSFFLCEYTCGKILFSTIFTPDCLKSIIDNTIGVNYTFLKEQVLNYGELIADRLADDENTSKEEMYQFMKLKHEKEPNCQRTKRIYAKLMIERFVQHSKEIEDENYSPELLQEFGVGVRLLTEVRRANPSDLLAKRQLAYILDCFQALDVCDMGNNEKTIISEIEINGAEEARITTEESLNSIFGSFNDETDSIIELDDLLPQLPEGRIISRDFSIVGEETLRIIHTQVLSFPYLPSEYEEACMYFEEDEVPETEDDCWVKRERLPIPLNWSGFGLEVCIFLNPKQDGKWAECFLKEFVCNIIAYNSDILTPICTNYGTVLKSIVYLDDDDEEDKLDEKEEEDEKMEESEEDNGEKVELHLLLTKLSNLPAWKYNSHIRPNVNSCFLIAAVRITPEQYAFAESNSVQQLLSELPSDTLISSL